MRWSGTSKRQGLERTAHGVIVFDGEARPSFVNDAAAQLITAGEALRIEQGRLCARSVEGTARLRSLVRAALESRRCGAMRIACGRGHHFVVLVAGTDVVGSDGIQGAVAILVPSGRFATPKIEAAAAILGAAGRERLSEPGRRDGAKQDTRAPRAVMSTFSLLEEFS